MNSNVQLAAGDQPGFYQFANASDDGSVVSLGGTVAIDDDGIHSPRPKCVAKAVFVDAKTSLALDYKYFQGPRDQISSQIFWSRTASANADAPANPCP